MTELSAGARAFGTVGHSTDRGVKGVKWPQQLQSTSFQSLNHFNHTHFISVKLSLMSEKSFFFLPPSYPQVVDGKLFQRQVLWLVSKFPVDLGLGHEHTHLNGLLYIVLLEVLPQDKIVSCTK